VSDGKLLGSGQPDPHKDEQDLWLKAGVANGVTAFEAKALYVVALIRHLLEASGKCIDGEHQFWLPAYVLAAEAAEALGRPDEAAGAGELVVPRGLSNGESWRRR
jgi:hypothetical protein